MASLYPLLSVVPRIFGFVIGGFRPRLVDYLPLRSSGLNNIQSQVTTEGVKYAKGKTI
jgi:hypothetical protein